MYILLDGYSSSISEQRKEEESTNCLTATAFCPEIQINTQKETQTTTQADR